jgi:hypothetical protein
VLTRKITCAVRHCTVQSIFQRCESLKHEFDGIDVTRV